MRMLEVLLSKTAIFNSQAIYFSVEPKKMKTFLGTEKRCCHLVLTIVLESIECWYFCCPRLPLVLKDYCGLLHHLDDGQLLGADIFALATLDTIGGLPALG